MSAREPSKIGFNLDQWDGGREGGGGGGRGQSPPPSDNFLRALKSEGEAKIRNCQCVKSNM